MRHSQWIFYLRAIAHFGGHLAARSVIRESFERTPAAVLAEYDTEREAFRQKFLASDWSVQDFVMSEVGGVLGDDYLFASLTDGQLRWGQEHVVANRRQLLRRVAQVVEELDAHSVMEIGSGTGRNLIHLKGLRPDLRIVGRELSPASVATARAAADRFGMDAEFHVEDMTTNWSAPPADLVFSVHALEQIPRNTADVVGRMRASALKGVVVWEPLPDLLQGLPRAAAELRIRYLDRLRAHAFEGQAPLSKVLLPFGSALNRTTEVRFAPAAQAGTA